MDFTKTENYQDLMTHDEKLKYSAYCKKTWGHIEDIISKGFETNEQFKPIIQSAILYHYNWLLRNPTFYNKKCFWEYIDSVKDEHYFHFRHPEVPRKDNDIDWDLVADKYHHYVLSPFAVDMVIKDKTNNYKRQELLNYIHKIPSKELQQMEVADFGCGPGNLIPHIAGKINKITGIDKSKGALDIAKTIASEHEVEFIVEENDLRTLVLRNKFDLIISVNSVLPEYRSDVKKIFAKINEHLTKDGQFVAILPSFDTTDYLKSLWQDSYKEKYGADFAKRIAQAIDLS